MITVLIVVNGYNKFKPIILLLTLLLLCYVTQRVENAVQRTHSNSHRHYL